MRAWLLVLPLALLGCHEQIVVRPDAGGAVSDSGTSGGADTGTGSPDSGRPDADAGPAPDGGDPTDAGSAACFVDPFDVCDDPAEVGRTNNEWPDASRFTESSVGCLSGDDLTPLDGHQVGVICHTEPADYFNMTVIPCDTLTMRLQVRLHVGTDCPEDRLALEVRHGGGIIGCGDTFDGQTMECLRDGDDRIMRILIPPGLSVQSWYFAVLSDYPDVRFDYDLQVTLQ